MATYGPLSQTAIAGIRSRAAAAGIADSPFALTSEAGLRGQLASSASQQAFEDAMALAQQRAAAVTGNPVPSGTAGFYNTLGNLGWQYADYRAYRQGQGGAEQVPAAPMPAAPTFRELFPPGGSFPYDPPKRSAYTVPGSAEAAAAAAAGGSFRSQYPQGGQFPYAPPSGTPQPSFYYDPSGSRVGARH